VDLIPSSPWLVGVEKALAAEVGAELVFRRAFEQLPRDRWDYCLLDCPPSLGLLAVAALVTCREVLVPVEAQVMALAGLAALLGTVERVKERLNPELALAGIIACRVDLRKNLAREVISRLRARFGKLVFQAMVRENVRLAEAPSFGKPITTYDPRSTGAEDYRAVAAELLKRGKGKTA
jgi:chromosome partitioning protein